MEPSKDTINKDANRTSPNETITKDTKPLECNRTPAIDQNGQMCTERTLDNSHKKPVTIKDPMQRKPGSDPDKMLGSDSSQKPSSDLVDQTHLKINPTSDDRTLDPELGSINCKTRRTASSSLPTLDVESSISSGTGSSEESDNAKPPLTRHQKITFLSLIISCILDNASFSILLPFFPLEAADKGVSSTVIGFIFGVYALVQFIVSPILGKYIPVIGAKFMFLSGLWVAGGCNLLFGILAKLPDGQPFIVWCFIVRIFEAIGAAAALTALYTMVARTFPARVAQMIGLVETASGIGFMLGPPIGGVLYQIGGYQLPFICLGVSVILSVIVNIFLLPSQGIQQKESGSLCQVLGILPIWPVLIALFIGSTGIGFLDPTLAPHLQTFNLSPTLIGVFFLIGSGIYALLSPFFGYLVDNKDVTRIMMILGFYISGLGYLLLGPSTLLKLPSELWIVGLGLGLLGIGWGCSLVPPFQDMLLTAVRYGLPDNLQTQGVISGLYMSIFSLGCFAGPSMAGIMIDEFGFNLSSTIYACTCFAVTIGLGLFCCWEYQCGLGRRTPNWKLTSDLKEDDEEVEPLLAGNRPTINL